MKKVLAVALSGVMALSMLTACGDSESYGDLTKKLNDATSADLTYTTANKELASKAYNEIIQLNETMKSLKDDLEDAGKESDEEDQDQKELGAYVAFMRRLTNINALSDAEDAKVHYAYAKKNATVDDVVAAIVAQGYITEGMEADFGYFIDQEFGSYDIYGYLEDDEGNETDELGVVKTVDECTVIVYVVG